MIHPDVQTALVEVVEGLVPDGVYTRLQADFHQHLPAVLVRAEQNDNDYLATHRAQLEFYHRSIPECRTMARLILTHLADNYHQTEAGLLDSVRIETNLREIPYTDTVVMFTASVFVDTRPI